MTSVVAFLGVGVMGLPMAGHLQKAGHSLRLFTRTPSKASPLVAAGGNLFGTPREAVSGASVVVSMLGLPSDVERVYLGPDGVVAHAEAGALLIDMTTSSPSLARRIAESGSRRGLRVLDAPVSGGDVGARAASLSIMVGGEDSAFQAGLPLLSLMGKNIVHHGAAGSGQTCKLANQVAVALNMLAWCEALCLAGRSGLDPQKVLTSIGGGAAASWSMTNLAPRALAGDLAPGFFVKHLKKDLDLVEICAKDSGCENLLTGLAVAKKRFETLAATEAGPELGTQALWTLFR